MVARLPLTTLLSQTLVAYTIEFDNEFEHRAPHHTTSLGPYAATNSGPWLASMAMWFNCMCHLGEEPLSVSELERRARTPTNLDGMRRWRYIDLERDPDDTRKKPLRSALMVRATSKGRAAQTVWRPLAARIEKRWEQRWGRARIDELRRALLALVCQFDLDLPNCMPILGYGLWSSKPSRPRSSPAPDARDAGALALPALLSRALLTFAVDFEGRSNVSLAICADLLRVLDAQAVPVRDLPRRSGVSKEAIAMAMGVLEKGGIAMVEPKPGGGAGKVVRLTPKGVTSRNAHQQLMHGVEDVWASRYGADGIATLRDVLEPLTGDDRGSLLFPALEPYPDGWRASVPKPETLPHFPMVLHRGGYPDGS